MQYLTGFLILAVIFLAGAAAEIIGVHGLTPSFPRHARLVTMSGIGATVSWLGLGASVIAVLIIGESTGSTVQAPLWFGCSMMVLFALMICSTVILTIFGYRRRLGPPSL